MGRVVWDLRCRGGAYDGLALETEQDPAEVLVVWRCWLHCVGHGTFNVEHPAIVLRTAESYRRVEIDLEQHRAVYEIGDGPAGPVVEEDELVGAGAGDWRET